jgi:hypothetical protein
MEPVRTSETSVNLYRTIHRYIIEDNTLLINCFFDRDIILTKLYSLKFCIVCTLNTEVFAYYIDLFLVLRN